MMADSCAEELFAARAAYVPGSVISWAALQHGRITFGATTPIEELAAFPLASVSKIFTSTLLALLAENLIVRLDMTLGELLDDKLPEPVAAITLEQLVTHTSGLPRLPIGLLQSADPANPYAHVDAALLRSYLQNTMPGAILDGRGSYEYSNFGFAVLGAALEAATGKAYADMLAEFIFQPADMSDSFVWAWDAPVREVVPGMDADGRAAMSWQMGAFAPAGGVVSNVGDMARFMRALLDRQSPIGVATRLAFEPRHSPAHGVPVGLGWQCSGALRWHNGETYSHHAMLAVDEETSSGVVAFWNAAVSVGDTCLHLLDTKLPLVELPTEVVLSKARLEALVGTYDAGTRRRLVVTLENTQLRLCDPLLGCFKIYPRDDRTFFRRSLSEGDYVFSIDLSGEIVLEQHRAGLTVLRARRLSS